MVRVGKEIQGGGGGLEESEMGGRRQKVENWRDHHMPNACLLFTLVFSFFLKDDY